MKNWCKRESSEAIKNNINEVNESSWTPTELSEHPRMWNCGYETSLEASRHDSSTTIAFSRPLPGHPARSDQTLHVPSDLIIALETGLESSTGPK
jgi:hypothetical protein